MKKLLPIFLCFLFIAMFWFGELNIEYSREALTLWFEKLVPSMFGIMVLVKILFTQGVFTNLGRWLGIFLGRLFHMDANSFAYVLASMFLGFPAQAVFINEQVAQHNITPKQGQRLLCCCSFATPGFVIMSCGNLLFHSTLMGVKVFLIQILSGLCLLLFTRKTRITSRALCMQEANDLQNSLKQAILESGITLYFIGGYLMFFMSLSALLVKLLPSSLQLGFRILSEFSSGSFLLYEQSLSPTLLLICLNMLLSFGGFCVHMQVMGMSKEVHLPYYKYFSFRILQAILACLFTILFVKIHWL